MRNKLLVHSSGICNQDASSKELESVSDNKSMRYTINILSSDWGQDLSSVNQSKFECLLSLDSDIKAQINAKQDELSHSSINFSNSVEEVEGEEMNDQSQKDSYYINIEEA